ncbi:deaminase [Roseicyclus sp. F158]|uniref:Deaminase n=1 Tax=Tropicimonas omnivorans TaxID=3075590 RepID=A0ABU3DHE8_9RHOB|nr:deaminase [Roseicyclus sp. F158]MDT0683115.1 deaminase [Roseicyclus sp. F158]
MQTDSDYLRRSVELHQRSHDPHRQVGALIVDSAGNIVSEGVNAPPDRFNFSKADTFRAIVLDPEWKYFMLEHAERNAINAAFSKGMSLSGSTMYASLYPCADCARAIVAAGISRLVVPDIGGDADRDTKWKAHYHYASKVFALGGVKVEVR